MSRYKRIELFESEANNLATRMPVILSAIRQKEAQNELPAVSAFRRMADACDKQLLKLDQIQRQFIAPAWNSLDNEEISRVRCIMDDSRAAIERAARDA